MDQSDQDRIAGRKWAEECSEFALGQSRDFIEGYRRGLKGIFGGDLTPADAMTEAEAIEFEAEKLGFSIYGDMSWGEAPDSFVGWLGDKNARLARYLKSDRWKERVRE
jgi:hypothetical protein